MSKSLKNFITIKDYLKQHDPITFRYFCLQTHYSSNVDFTDQRIYEAQNLRQKFESFFSFVKNTTDYIRSEFNIPTLSSQAYERKWLCIDKDYYEYFLKSKEAIKEHLSDDFDTPGALKRIVELLNRSYFYMSPTINRTAKYYNTDNEKQPELIKDEELHPIISLLENVENYVVYLLTVFGFHIPSITRDPQIKDNLQSITPELLHPVAQFRSTVRKELLPLVKQQKKSISSNDPKPLPTDLDQVIKKLLSNSDEIRDKVFPGLGYTLKDLSDGSYLITPKTSK